MIKRLVLFYILDTVTSLNAKRDKDKEKALGITDDESSVNQSGIISIKVFLIYD